MDAADAVGVAGDQGGWVDAGPLEVSGVGAEADDVGSEGVEELGDFGFGFEDAADVGVVEGSEAVALEDLADDAGVVDGEGESVGLVVGADGGLGHAGGDGHGGDHGAVEAEGGLVGGEAFGAFDFVGDVDGFVERVS